MECAYVTLLLYMPCLANIEPSMSSDNHSEQGSMIDDSLSVGLLNCRWKRFYSRSQWKNHGHVVGLTKM